MSGVSVRFLNRDEALSRLSNLARKLLVSNQDVMEVSLFGSLARGNHGPRSDADIHILLTKDARRFIDRIPEFLDHFGKAGLPVEVFPYTREELKLMSDRGFIRTILKERIVLATRAR